MLFDAALLSTSATITQVAEAFALSESMPTMTTGAQLASSIPSFLGVGPQQLVPQQVSDASRLANLRGMSLLQELALLPAASIAEFVSENPQVVQELLAAPPSPRSVQLWWSDMDADASSALLASAPSIVGNLEGIPVELRDVANRSSLDLSIASLPNPQSATAGRASLVDASNRLRMLEQVEQALSAGADSAPRSLLAFDPSGTGTAAIVIGDLQTADYVTYLVPGMFYTVDSQMTQWAASAQDFYNAESMWLEAEHPSGGQPSIATVAWIGYETPSLVNFTSLDLAYQGRDALATAIEGLHTIRGDDQPYLSVVAHSYGSTVAMLALTDYGIDIDALALVGSPGSAAQQASDLGVPSLSVYVGEAAWDQVKDSAFFGSDPGSDSFGAQLFSVDGGLDPVTGEPLSASTGHNEYLVPGSESLRNLVLVALGEGVHVTRDR